MASFSVINNIPSLNGQNQLYVNNLNLATTLNRLASGKRINTGADDAAGLQIADSLRGNVMALNQAARNASDGIGFLQIADGALEQVTALLHRAVTLATEAESEILDDKARNALNQEYTAIMNEIDRIKNNTNFNGTQIFGGTLDGINSLAGAGCDSNSLEIFVGDMTMTKSYISVKVGTFTGSILMGSTGISLGGATSLAALKNGLSHIAVSRGNIGAGMNRLQAAISVIKVTATNTLAAESGIRDADMAAEISNLTKYQILAQTGMAALSQANSNMQNVLTLLRG